MADLVVKQHDTWPPLKGAASDENGLLDFSGTATRLKFLMKSGATLISGTALAINPPDSDGNNWQYVWRATDTSIIGTYEAELEVTWDAVSSPNKIETIPNDGTLEIEVQADQG